MRVVGGCGSQEVLSRESVGGEGHSVNVRGGCHPVGKQLKRRNNGIQARFQRTKTSNLKKIKGQQIYREVMYSLFRLIISLCAISSNCCLTKSVITLGRR